MVYVLVEKKVDWKDAMKEQLRAERMDELKVV